MLVVCHDLVGIMDNHIYQCTDAPHSALTTPNHPNPAPYNYDYPPIFHFGTFSVMGDQLQSVDLSEIHKAQIPSWRGTR